MQKNKEKSANFFFSKTRNVDTFVEASPDFFRLEFVYDFWGSMISSCDVWQVSAHCTFAVFLLFINVWLLWCLTGVSYTVPLLWTSRPLTATLNLPPPSITSIRTDPTPMPTLSGQSETSFRTTTRKTNNNFKLSLISQIFQNLMPQT